MKNFFRFVAVLVASFTGGQEGRAQDVNTVQLSVMIVLLERRDRNTGNCMIIPKQYSMPSTSSRKDLMKEATR